MAEIAIIRYVNSLYQLATEEHIEEELLHQLTDVINIFLKNEDFYFILQSETYKKEEKKIFFEEIFSGKIHTYLLNFVKILIDNGRLGFIEEIKDSYKKLYYDSQNIKEFEAITSIPMTESQKERLIEQLKKLTEANEVYLSNKVDSGIIGGMKLKSDDIELDQSIQTKLEKMKQQLQEKIM